jgi:hypothetical protein
MTCAWTTSCEATKLKSCLVRCLNCPPLTRACRALRTARRALLLRIHATFTAAAAKAWLLIYAARARHSGRGPQLRTACSVWRARGQTFKIPALHSARSPHPQVPLPAASLLGRLLLLHLLELEHLRGRTAVAEH